MASFDALIGSFPVTPTGDTSDLPPIVPPLPITVRTRFDADTIPGADGDLIDSWTDTLGEYTLIAPSPAGRPTLKIAGGHKFLRFDGTDDELFLATPPPGIVGFGLLGRVPVGVTANTQEFFGADGSGFGLTRTSTNMGFFFGGTPSRSNTSVTTANEWRRPAMRTTSGDARVQWSETVFSTNATAATLSATTAIHVGRRGSGYGQVDISDVVLFNYQADDATLTAWFTGIGAIKASLIAT